MSNDKTNPNKYNLFDQGLNYSQSWMDVLGEQLQGIQGISTTTDNNTTINPDYQYQYTYPVQHPGTGVFTQTGPALPTVEDRMASVEKTLIEVVSLLKLIGSVILDRVPEIKAKGK